MEFNRQTKMHEVVFCCCLNDMMLIAISHKASGETINVEKVEIFGNLKLNGTKVKLKEKIRLF